LVVGWICLYGRPSFALTSAVFLGRVAVRSGRLSGWSGWWVVGSLFVFPCVPLYSRFGAEPASRFRPYLLPFFRGVRGSVPASQVLSPSLRVPGPGAPAVVGGSGLEVWHGAPVRTGGVCGGLYVPVFWSQCGSRVVVWMLSQVCQLFPPWSLSGLRGVGFRCCFACLPPCGNRSHRLLVLRFRQTSRGSIPWVLWTCSTYELYAQNRGGGFLSCLRGFK